MSFFRIRLLPVTLIALVMVLGIRVGDLFVAGEGRPVQLSTAQAATDPEEAAPKPEDVAKTEESDPKMADEEKVEMAVAAGSLAGRDPTTFSPSEIALLESLARRRDEIEGKATALDVREGLLEATEQRIDDKIAALKKLETRIGELVKQHEADEEARLGKLVIVYEKMKPKDAARIFDRIDLDILLEVTGRMKEAKVADVLAKMAPERAQELTIALATRNDLDANIER